MRVRTPRKYRRYRYARRNIIPCGRIFYSLLALCLIVLGVGIYQNRDMLTPVVEQGLNRAVDSVSDGIATLNAPTRTPTKNPVNELVQADNFWSRGAVSEALNVYEGILGSLPNDLDVYYRTALGHIILGNYDQAVAIAENAITAAPLASDAWAIRAWALDWAGDVNGAMSSALLARELNPDSARAAAWLAEAYFSDGQTQRARNIAEEAVQLDPDSVEAHRARGLISRLGFFETASAMTDFRTAYEIAYVQNPALATFVAIDVAQLEIRNANYQAALDILESVLALNPQSLQALYWMGTTHYSYLGDPNQAIGYFQRCVDYNPQSVNCYYFLGRSQESLERMESAAESFVQAIENGSQSARHHWWAGRTQISIGSCSRATDYIQKGFALAQELGDQQLIADYQAIMPLCQIQIRPTMLPTSTASTATPRPANTPTPRPTRVNRELEPDEQGAY